MISDVSRKLSELDHKVRELYADRRCYNEADGLHALIVSFKHLKQTLNFLLTEFHVCEHGYLPSFDRTMHIASIFARWQPRLVHIRSHPRLSFNTTKAPHACLTNK